MARVAGEARGGRQDVPEGLPGDEAVQAEVGIEGSSMLKVAVIGSFKRHYVSVLQAIEDFRKAGWEVTSPAGAAIIQPGINFVRFTSDEETLSDSEIQTVTLRNIFSAQMVFVVAPGGYVGRTTCYEIGRLVQARKPVYFSEQPLDLPIEVAPNFVGSATALVERFAGGDRPEWLFEFAAGALYDGERDLAPAGR